MSPQPTCALGFRVKTGWAAVVLLGGPRTAPRLLDSRILALSDPGEPESRQPYHAGFGTAQSDNRKVERLVRGIERFSRNAIGELMAEYGNAHRVRKAGIVVPSLTDPATITNPHMRAHASEGRLFRTVVIDGLERCGLSPTVVLERDVYQQLGKALGHPAQRIKALVAELGSATTPWRAEQKVATAVALLTLG